MTKYFISFPGSAMDISDEGLAKVGEAAHAVIREAKSAGVYVFNGGINEDVAPLMVTADGTVTSETYPQTKEFDGGFCVLELPSREAAVQWAAKIAEPAVARRNSASSGTTRRADRRTRSFSATLETRHSLNLDQFFKENNMAREIIRVEPLSSWLERWKAPTSADTRHGYTIYVSGFPPFDPQTGEVLDAPIEQQTQRVLEQLKLCVEAAGSSLDQVLKCNVYCTSVAMFPVVNEIYARFFSEPPPARIFVNVPAWPGHFDIEIDCVAAI